MNKYFTTGDEKSLKNGLEKILQQKFEPIDYDMTPYDWDKIALQTDAVYRKVVHKK